MKTLEWHGLQDRSQWGNGRWDEEPDKKQWQDEATGLPCLLVRNPMGSLCGYVGVDHAHPYFMKHVFRDDIENKVWAHGGLTYSSKCDGVVCHEVEPGENDDIWWFGFDCAHWNDFCPQYLGPMFKDLTAFMNRSDYKEVSWVKEECSRLAKQLKEVTVPLLTT